MSDADTPVIWEDPPEVERNSGYGKWAKKLAPFRKHPGKWGRLPGDPLQETYAYNLATRINTGKVSGAQPGEFEATSRRTDDGHHVWVRYVGDDN